MDIDGLLQSVIRFSNFMSSRLVVSGLFFYVMSGFTEVGSVTEGFLPNLDLVNGVIANYQNIFDILGVSDFALLLIFFLFLTAIHVVFVAFDRLGHYIPPAIVPLPGWQAIDDLTGPTFDILREARGAEHTEEENQRLFEFKRKLEAIDTANEESHAEEIATISSAFRVAKTMAVFSLAAFAYALVSGRYTGDTVLLLIILGSSMLVVSYAILSIYRSHSDRITELREEVIHQLTGFAGIWLPAEHHQRVIESCVPNRDLKPAEFEVMMPVYGTLDEFVRDMRKWKIRRARRGGRTPA